MLVLFSLLMAVPLAFALSEHDPAEWAFLISIGVTFATGVLLSLATRRFRRELQPRDGFILVSLTWLPDFLRLVNKDHPALCHRCAEVLKGAFNG